VNKGSRFDLRVHDDVGRSKLNIDSHVVLRREFQELFWQNWSWNAALLKSWQQRHSVVASAHEFVSISKIDSLVIQAIM
jgi:hypothetical protein